GPFTPGFRTVTYGDSTALRDVVTERTAAVLLEPVQGEAGVIAPPAGYFAEVRQLCDQVGALLIADEIQSGLGRTGSVLALDHEAVRADLYTLGKALGGGIVPVSAVVGSRAVVSVLRPGEHGSTFGGNPLACAVAREVISLLRSGELPERAVTLGHRLHSRLAEVVGHGATELRGRGLWAGLDIGPNGMSGWQASLDLADRGVLCKPTHGATLRIAPPLVIDETDLETGIDAICEVITA